MSKRVIRRYVKTVYENVPVTNDNLLEYLSDEAGRIMYDEYPSGLSEYDPVRKVYHAFVEIGIYAKEAKKVMEKLGIKIVLND